MKVIDLSADEIKTMSQEINKKNLALKHKKIKSTLAVRKSKFQEFSDYSISK